MMKLLFLLLLVYFGHANDTFKLSNTLPSDQFPSQIQQGTNKKNDASILESNVINEEQSTDPCQKNNIPRLDSATPAKVKADENENKKNLVLIENEKSLSLDNNISPIPIIILSSSENIPRSRRIIPGILKNPTKEESEYIKFIQHKPQPDDTIQFPHNTRRSYVPILDKATNNDNIEDDLNLTEERSESVMEDQLADPTKGEGISNIKDRGVSLLQNNRVCYACSSMSDPTCWAPDKMTTTKYCQMGHNSCLTKSFKYKGTSFVVRDCGSYCVNQNGNQYSSCSICHSDLCNSASTISLFNVTIAIAIVFGILFNKR